MFSPSKGSLPTSSSWSITPSADRSLRWLAGAPFHISGAMCLGVPIT